MAYKRVEFHTKNGKSVSFRVRAKTKSRVRVKRQPKRTGTRVRGNSDAAIRRWGYGRVA